MVVDCRQLVCDEGSNDQVLDPWVQITPLVPLSAFGRTDESVGSSDTCALRRVYGNCADGRDGIECNK
jgi:hypothetical protein